MTGVVESPRDFPIKYCTLWTLKEFQTCGLLRQNFCVCLPTGLCSKVSAVDLLELRCQVPKPHRNFRCLFQIPYEQMSDCSSYNC